MIRRGLLCLMAIAALGCGGTDVPDEAGPGLTPAARLQALVPTLDGWTRGDVRAQTITEPEAATTATASYTRNEGRLDLEISDTGGTSSMLESLGAMAGSDINREVANGYFKGTTVAGHPAVESWNTVDRLGELTVLVGNRFIVHVGGRALDDAAPMRALVERIALGELH